MNFCARESALVKERNERERQARCSISSVIIYRITNILLEILSPILSSNSNDSRSYFLYIACVCVYCILFQFFFNSNYFYIYIFIEFCAPDYYIYIDSKNAFLHSLIFYFRTPNTRKSFCMFTKLEKVVLIVLLSLRVHHSTQISFNSTV